MPFQNFCFSFGLCCFMALKTPTLVRLIFRSYNGHWPKFLANYQKKLASNRKKFLKKYKQKYSIVFGQLTKKNWKSSCFWRQSRKLPPYNHKNDLKNFGNNKKFTKSNIWLESLSKKINPRPISANDLLFHKHSVQIFRSLLVKEISSVCCILCFKAFYLALEFTTAFLCNSCIIFYSACAKNKFDMQIVLY